MKLNKDYAKNCETNGIDIQSQSWVDNRKLLTEIISV